MFHIKVKSPLKRGLNEAETKLGISRSQSCLAGQVISNVSFVLCVWLWLSPKGFQDGRNWRPEGWPSLGSAFPTGFCRVLVASFMSPSGRNRLHLHVSISKEKQWYPGDVRTHYSELPPVKPDAVNILKVTIVEPGTLLLLLMALAKQPCAIFFGGGDEAQGLMHATFLHSVPLPAPRGIPRHHRKGW